MCAIYVFDGGLDFSSCVACAQGKEVYSKSTAEVIAPSQAAVERAAVNVRAGLARNMVAPKTSYVSIPPSQGTFCGPFQR
jgi:hypothetical protein